MLAAIESTHALTVLIGKAPINSRYWIGTAWSRYVLQSAVVLVSMDSVTVIVFMVHGVPQDSKARD